MSRYCFVHLEERIVYGEKEANEFNGQFKSSVHNTVELLQMMPIAKIAQQLNELERQKAQLKIGVDAQGQPISTPLPQYYNSNENLKEEGGVGLFSSFLKKCKKVTDTVRSTFVRNFYPDDYNKECEQNVQNQINGILSDTEKKFPGQLEGFRQLNRDFNQLEKRGEEISTIVWGKIYHDEVIDPADLREWYSLRDEWKNFNSTLPTFSRSFSSSLEVENDFSEEDTRNDACSSIVEQHQQTMSSKSSKKWWSQVHDAITMTDLPENEKTEWLSWLNEQDKNTFTQEMANKCFEGLSPGGQEYVLVANAELLGGDPDNIVIKKESANSQNDNFYDNWHTARLPDYLQNKDWSSFAPSFFEFLPTTVFTPFKGEYERSIEREEQRMNNGRKADTNKSGAKEDYYMTLLNSETQATTDKSTNYIKSSQGQPVTLFGRRKLLQIDLNYALSAPAA